MNTYIELFEALTAGDYDYARLRCRNTYAVQDYCFCIFHFKLPYDEAERLSEAATATLILRKMQEEDGTDFGLPIQQLWSRAIGPEQAVKRQYAPSTTLQTEGTHKERMM